MLIDGGFFLRRHRSLLGDATPVQVANDLHKMCLEHLRVKQRDQKVPPRRESDLYRVFYYDCPPLLNKAHNPVTRAPIDFSKTRLAQWRLAFFDELKKLRKVAVRLGYLDGRSGNWVLRPQVLKDVLARKISPEQLADRDVKYDIRQKGVDMRIGLDIASLAYKRFGGTDRTCIGR